MKLTAFFRAQEPLNVPEPDMNLDAVARSRATFVAGLEPMQKLRAEMLAALPVEDPAEPLPAYEQDRARRILEDVRALDEGNWALGISDLRLEPFVGGPSIRLIEKWIATCDEVIARESARRAMTWPAPFCYTGGPGLMRFDGRVLRRGDVVRLSRTQAEAWVDRFAPAVEETVSS